MKPGTQESRTTSAWTSGQKTSSPSSDPTHPAQTKACCSSQSSPHPYPWSVVAKPHFSGSHPAASLQDPCCCTPKDADVPDQPQSAPNPPQEFLPACSQSAPPLHTDSSAHGSSAAAPAPLPSVAEPVALPYPRSAVLSAEHPQAAAMQVSAA